ncbi:DUF4214 domain-containing protein [Pseudomonas sp. Marseille-QA0892]
MAVTASQVQALYVGYLGRAADKAGLDFWVNAINTGVSTLESAALGFTLSAEYKAQYDGLSTEDLVGKVYENVLGRAADAEGKAFWVAEIAKGTVTADTLVAAMVNSLGELDTKTINNKVFVANAYTAAAGDAYDAEAGASVLEGVNSDASTLAGKLQSIDNGQFKGLVPGLALLQGLNSAEAAVEAYAKANTASVDQLMKDNKLSFDKDTSFGDKIIALSSINGATTPVNELTVKAENTQKALDAEFAKLSFAQRTLVNKFVAADKALDAAKEPSAEEVAEAQGQIQAAQGFAAAATAAKLNVTTGGELWTAYVDASDADRAKIAEAFKNVSTFTSTFKVAADKQVAYDKAEKAQEDAANAIVSLTGYTNAYGADKDADKALADAKTADAAKAAVETYVNAYEALTDRVSELSQKVAQSTSGLVDATEGDITAVGTAKAETFFFGEAVKAGDTFAVNFEENDHFFIGNSYTFNKGELADGNNNALEFFLVKGENDTNVKLVVEAVNYGSQNDGAGAAVIELTGVTSVDQLTVQNGLISHV